MRLITKEQRLQAQQAQFDYMAGKGYSREDYKGLKFFTIDEGKYFTLKVFKDTSANHLEYINYRTAESRAAKIQQYKDGYERQISYKAELKANPKKSSAANCAAAIREELKSIFTGIKFSVKSDNFSMGDSVDISWTDGPTSDEVSNITSKYQYGNFNGMEDMYEHTNSRDDIPQSKYVQTHRHQSEEVSALMPVLESLYKCNDENDRWRNNEQIFYRMFSKSSFPVGAVFTGIERTDCDCGSIEDFYKITFTAPEQQQQPTAKNTEALTNSIKVIDYSEKAIAVIGDFSKYYDKLIAAGGRYNSRLSCGKGIIFSKKRIEQVKEILSEPQQQVKEVKQLPAPQQTTLKDEVRETINFLSQTDVKIYGEITKGTRQAAKVQNVDIYETIEEIEHAAQTGKVISMCNLFELVNSK